MPAGTSNLEREPPNLESRPQCECDPSSSDAIRRPRGGIAEDHAKVRLPTCVEQPQDRGHGGHCVDFEATSMETSDISENSGPNPGMCIPQGVWTDEHADQQLSNDRRHAQATMKQQIADARGDQNYS